MSKLPIARRIAGNCGVGATLFQLATSMFREAELLKPVESRAALDAYFQILSACLSYDDGDGRTLRHGRELTSRILNFIEAHLPEPGLDPQRIASAAGISVRHLHRVFAVQGRTVAEWIRQRRLQECQKDLADIRLRDRTITEIAFFWGFSDSAHFSRSFRKQFGITAHAFRASALPKGWNEDNSEGSGLLSGMPAGIPYPKPN